MTTSDATQRKEFLSTLIRARHRRPSFVGALWASRMALLQWVAVIAVSAMCFGLWWGPARATNVLPVGTGLLFGLVLQVRRYVQTWPWWVDVIDWGAVERETSRPEDGATGTAP